MILSDGAALDFAPQALGETIPTLSNGFFYAKDGLTLAGKFASYSALYRVQPSVATLVDKIANSAARLTLKVWDHTSPTGKVQDTTSDFAKLLASPTTTMSPFNFWRWTVSTYEVFGEAFWYKVRGPLGEVIQLLPMHPSRTTVKRGDDGEITYVFSLGVASAGLLHAPARDVVPFLRFNPDSLMRGMSRLEPLRSTLLNEDSSRRATESWWRRGARPSVALKHPGELSKGAQDRLRANWESQHAGADLMGGTAILEEGMEAQIIQLSADEMQYIESRKLNLQEACMVYDVPPPVVHILDHATYSNITEQMRSMYRDTMSPRLEDIESVIDFHLRTDFFQDASHTAAFALDEVLRGDFETRADSVQKLVMAGVMKPSEARPLFDLPDAGPVADVLFGNAALVPLGSSVHSDIEIKPDGTITATPTTPPAAASATPEVAPSPAKTAASPLVRSIMGRIGRAKAAGSDVRAQLVDEHRQALTRLFEGQRASAKAQTKSLGDGWDDQLAELLTDLGMATARAIGSTVAKSLGGSYDVTEVAEWIHDNAITSAQAINATTVKELQAALDEADDPGEAVDEVFDGQVSQRTEAIAAARVAMVGGLAGLNSASQNKAATKTWLTGPNPRPAHAQMNGETVPIDEPFSNGMNMPGDPAGGADEVAGCNCDVQFDF